MEDSLPQIISELESQHNLQSSDLGSPLSESSILGLQTLFDADESDRLWEELSSKNLPASILVRPITAAMDGALHRISLSASHLYLTILISPNSPIFTIFTPVAFLSLLRSIRRSFKHQRPAGQTPSDEGPPRKTKRSKKRSGSQRLDGEETGDDSGGSGSHVDARLLFTVLGKLESVLDKIHLSRFPDALKSLVDTVAGIPITALESSDDLGNFNWLCNLCFRILNGILQPVHGDQTVAAVEVLKSLAVSFLLLKSQVRTFALAFVTGKVMALARECDAVRKAVVYLPRYLANKAPEKSEPRAAAVDSIMEVVRAMELDDQVGFADYVVEMTRGKAHLRLVAVDLILAMLTSLTDPLGVNAMEGAAEEGRNWWGMRCVEALVERCSDAAAAIRARSLTNVAQVIGSLSGDPRNSARLQEVMGFGTSGGCIGFAGGMNELLRKRCMDEKAAVRKAALFLIMKSTDLIGSCVNEVLLKTISIACSDPLVSIRKAGVLALSEVFRKFPNSRVIREWLHTVPQLITDNEASIQTECENLFQELVLDRVCRVVSAGSRCKATSHSSMDSGNSLVGELESIFPEGVLVLLERIRNGEVAPCVRKICMSLGKKKQLRPIIATALQNIISTSESIWLRHSMPIEKWTAPPGAWLLLSEVSSYVPKAVKWEFLHHHWQLLDKAKLQGRACSPQAQEEMASINDIDSNSVAWAGDRVFLLQTIANISVELPSEPAAELAHDLLKRIEEFNMHSAEVNAHVKALRMICKQKALNSEEGDSLISKWVNQLLSQAQCILEEYFLEVTEVIRDDGFLTPPKSGSRKGKRAGMETKLLRAVTAVFTIGAVVVVSPSADLKGIVPLLHTIITSGSSQAKPKEFAGLKVSIKQVAPSLYIQSWLTMGKLCLADGKLANRYIPLFVQELEKSECAALRNNIVVVMADFCVHYTALVDCYIPKITNSLRDPCEVVRRQTFVMLSRLLQRDYVKWRGVLFLRFLLSLVDESEKIRHLADFLFGNILKAKAPLLAYNGFVEAIFVLNDCNAHTGHSESHGSQSGHQLFSIRGNDEKSRSKRMHIYVSLLKQMAPEHLLATSAKLCAEILAAASEGALDLDDIAGQSVLKDALQILACKEMRIQPNRSAAAAAADMDEEGGDSGGAAAAAAARGRVVTQVAKKNLIQNAVPIFIELKRLLETKNSPLTGSLMECLRALLKDYKNEMEEILVADKQLQKELIYDMQKYEAAKTKSTVAEAVASIQRSAAHRSPAAHATAASGAPRASTGDELHERLAGKLGAGDDIAAAVADAAAVATVRSVLKDVNKGTSTPPLHSMNMPKLKTCSGGAVTGERPSDVLESLRRRQFFDSDEEN